MSGHTPGPWFVTGSMTKYIEARIGDGMLQEVAAVGPTAADGGYGEQQQANANLIAAAPDLLEALENCERRLTDMVGTSDLCANELQSSIDVARAVIARAKGEK